VSFDGRSVTYEFGELDMLVPAYAATIHKSQGSEYPAVIIAVLTQHYAMLQRNLLYTGLDATDIRKSAGTAARTVGRSDRDPHRQRRQCRRDRRLAGSTQYLDPPAAGD